MKASIRPARESDYEALCRLWARGDALHARLQPGFFRTAPGLPRPYRYLSEALAAENEALLVAVVGRELVGLVHIKLFDTPVHPLKVQRRRGHVEDLVVEQDYRRQGVGRALMEAAARWCQERGGSQLLLTVWSGNQPAEAFYRRLGYRPVSSVLALDLADLSALAPDEGES